MSSNYTADTLSDRADTSSEYGSGSNSTADTLSDDLDGGRIFGIVLIVLTFLGLGIAGATHLCRKCRRGGQRARLMDGRADNEGRPRLKRTNTMEIAEVIGALNEEDGSPRKVQDFNDPEWAES